MSRLARVTKVVADAVPGNAAVLSDEGVPAWVRYRGEVGDRLIGDGALLLDLSDVSSVDDLVATRVLDGGPPHSTSPWRASTVAMHSVR